MTRNRVGLVVLIALLVSVLGIAPHLAFSSRMGQLSYFKYSYDEESYATLALNGPILVYRLFSICLFRAVHLFASKNLESTLILSDVVFPALCALSAGSLASHVVNDRWARSLLVLSILFGQEFFSLGYRPVWRDHLVHLRTALTPLGSQIIPDYSTSSFALFRTPEPQVSYIFAFAFLAYLLALLGSETPKLKRRQVVWLLLFNTFLPFIHVFLSVPLLGLEIGLAVMMWLSGRIYVGVAFLMMSLYSFLAILLTRFLPSAMDVSSYVFPSRLPVLTPSVIAGAVLLVVVVIVEGRRILRLPCLSLSLICLGLPPALMNQQVLTGMMVSTRDFERYTNYVFLILGVSLFLSERLRKTRRRIQLAIFLTLFFTAFLIVGQSRTFRSWYPQNEQVEAQRRALLAAGNVDLYRTRLLLEEPELGPLLSVKMGHPLRLILNYNELFLASQQISPMTTEGGVPEGRAKHESDLFEHFARLNKTPKEVSDLLEDEARSKNGYYLGFLFALRDYWYPITDDRLVRQDEVLRGIGPIVSLYQQQLAKPNGWLEPVIFLTRKPPDSLKLDDRWSYRLLSSGSAGNSVAYAYLQERRNHY